LFEAIEQDCDYGHIDYLVKSFKMDVMVIKDLLLSKAIDSCSYDALLWLQENASVDLKRIRDGGRNCLLHQIARSPYAEHFFWKAGFVDRFKDTCECFIELGRQDYGEAFILQTNNQRRSWLHELVISGNSGAMDLALSPKGNLAWTLSLYLEAKDCGREGPISDICGTAYLLGRYGIEKMIDDLSLTLRSIGLGVRPFEVPSSKVLSKFGGETVWSPFNQCACYFSIKCNNGHNQLVNSCELPIR
jgi:hypothetical protein